MANTTKLKGKILEIKGLDADWSLPGDLPGFRTTGLFIRRITFHASNAADVFIIKQGKAADTSTAGAIVTTATDPRIFDAVGQTSQKFGGDVHGFQCWPYIDISDCTLNTAANARIEIELA